MNQKSRKNCYLKLLRKRYIMDKTPAPIKQEGQLTVQYNTFRGVMEFFYGGEQIYWKTIPQCEKLLPHIIWWSIKQKPHVRYIL